MQATLTFKLPEEQSEHRNAVDAGKAFSLLNHIVQQIRDRLKYGPEETDVQFIERLRSEILEDFPDIYER